VARCVIARHRDRIAAEALYHVGHLIEAAENRNSVGNWSRQLLRGQAKTDDLHSRVRLALDALDELLSRRRASGHNHVTVAATLPLQSAQNRPGKDTGQ
jgi:hypothetical protein